jgi:NodT family efflux transporter outer membrane factor (OMF) lipoprotein
MNKMAKRQSHWSRLAILGTIVFLPACAVGPKYTRPTVQVPTEYKEQNTASSTATDVWKAAQPSDQAARGNWWELFNDSQLNALEEKVNLSNQSLKVAEAQYRGARALVHSSRAGYYPTVTASPSITATHPSANRSIRPSIAAGTFGDYVLPVDFSYEADLWGRVRRTVEASSASAQASAADLETARLSFQAELAVDYFMLRELDAERQLLDVTVGAYQKALELTKNRHDSGVASGADVAQADTQLETTRAQAIDLNTQRAQFEHAIALLVGQPASTFSLSPLPISGPPPEIPVGVPSELLERRPDIAGAERRVVAANAQIGIARTAYFPSLTLAASAGFESTGLAQWLAWPSRFWSVGPSLIQTLFDGGRRRALSDQAQASYDATVASYRENVLAAFQEVEDNLAALRILAEENQVQEGAVKAAERSLEISTNRYQGGVTTYLDVITAQSALLSDQRTAVNLLQRRMTASVLLIKALGGGWNSATLPTAKDLISRLGPKTSD